jgi:predicted Ser/Thr protein kinase
MSALAVLSRDDLAQMPRQSLGKASAFKPSVWRVETPGGPIVLKDAHHVGRSTRWLARWLLARERRILERLRPVDGVPHLVAWIDPDCIVLSVVPGRPLEERVFRERPREIVAQLLELTQRLHARGVFHLDLHQRKNVLIDGEGRLHLVDFGAAVAPGPVMRFLFGGVLHYADRQAAYKYLARFTPEELSEAEARAVVRYGRLRWLWPFSPHSRRPQASARARLR